MNAVRAALFAEGFFARGRSSSLCCVRLDDREPRAMMCEAATLRSAGSSPEAQQNFVRTVTHAGAKSAIDSGTGRWRSSRKGRGKFPWRTISSLSQRQRGWVCRTASANCSAPAQNSSILEASFTTTAKQRACRLAPSIGRRHYTAIGCATMAHSRAHRLRFSASTSSTSFTSARGSIGLAIWRTMPAAKHLSRSSASAWAVWPMIGRSGASFRIRRVAW